MPLKNSPKIQPLLQEKSARPLNKVTAARRIFHSVALRQLTRSFTSSPTLPSWHVNYFECTREGRYRPGRAYARSPSETRNFSPTKTDRARTQISRGEAFFSSGKSSVRASSPAPSSLFLAKRATRGIIKGDGVDRVGGIVNSFVILRRDFEERWNNNCLDEFGWKLRGVVIKFFHFIECLSTFLSMNGYQHFS